ncbi:Uncharacterised protein [Achromobacter denitrificans]|nr:hypothetical protein LMG1231_02927 [Achromobacter denitrificans]SUU15731.1 Uncharacterised protein [Achromobacter denitrificans]
MAGAPDRAGHGRRPASASGNLDNRRSHAFHQGLGFEETERVVFFRKRIRPQRQGLPT